MFFKWTGVLILLFSISLSAEAKEPSHQVYIEKAVKLNLHKDDVWLSLIHSHSRIPDSKFYLSSNNTAIDELQETIRILVSNPKERCRFPARWFYLKNKLNLSERDQLKCDDLLKFETRAPLDNISIIFASENISLPSTMMGHTFIKISGKDSNNLSREHAISFFTNLNEGNFLSLIVESILIGKRGYYSLSPYQPILNNYVAAEERNIWDYQLSLSSYEKKLIHLHLYELKDLYFKYYFQSYNCSSLIFNILAVVRPEINRERSFWDTPLDLIRSIEKLNLIEHTSVNLSSKAKIRAIDQTIKDKQIRRKIYNKEVKELSFINNKETRILSYNLSKAINDYQYEKREINHDDWKINSTLIVQNFNELDINAKLDLSNYKKPTNIPPDSQISLKLTKNQNNRFLKFEYIPASHELIDNNLNYLNESSLILFSPGISWNLKEEKLALHSFILYSAESYQPSTKLSPSFSGKFRLSYEESYNSRLEKNNDYIIHGSFGKTYRFHQAIDFYILLGTGYLKSLDAFIINTDAGLIIREKGNYKTIINYNATKPIFSKQKLLQILSLSQKLAISETKSIVINIEKPFLNNIKQLQLDLNFKLIF